MRFYKIIKGDDGTNGRYTANHAQLWVNLHHMPLVGVIRHRIKNHVHFKINTNLVDTSTGFLTLSVYEDITLRAQSIIQLADISETLPWVGWLRFDFNKQPLTASESYKLTLQSSGIQPDGVSIVRDYHVANTYNVSDQRVDSPLKFEIYYRDI